MSWTVPDCMNVEGGLCHPLLIWQAAVLGPLRAEPGRALLSIVGIALGLALGLAVTLINRTAVNEFSQAVQRVSGSADWVLRGPRAGFSEEIYPLLARDPAVAVASPALEFTLSIEEQREPLNILALDYFQARQLGQPGQAPKSLRDDIGAIFDPDAITLSASAAHWLQRQAGDTLTVRTRDESPQLKIMGVLPIDAPTERLGIMDIAGAQWRFGYLGKISRIDLRLRAGTDGDEFAARINDRLPAGLLLERPRAGADRAANLSRAYRVNLGVLSSIALFTGAFLVFATLSLSILRRRPQLALLRILGVTRRGLIYLLLLEGASIGVIGALLGVALGFALAAVGLTLLGGDLGGGYFQGASPPLQADPWVLAGFFILGVLLCMLGALAPALDTARSALALAIKGGDAERSLKRLSKAWPGLSLMALGGAAAFAPSLDGLPLLAYAGVGLILIGVILLMPKLLFLISVALPLTRYAVVQIAILQLRGAPGRAAMAVAAIMVSFSLMVAMAIMVSSFRLSLDEWLGDVLRADLYLSNSASGDSDLLTPEAQRFIKKLTSVKHVEFLRFQELLLASGKAPLTLIARPIDRNRPEQVLPLLDRGSRLATDTPPVWVSEAARDLYGFQPGARIELPIAGKAQSFTVAGVWRDYARQTGAVVIELKTYRRLTGDELANDAALWLAPGAIADRVIGDIRAHWPDDDTFDIRTPGEIRKLSLAIFDRSFAVTYLLEIIAVLIGLFAIGNSFGAEIVARRAEVGMLRHIGMTRAQIAAMLGVEAGIIAVVGVGVGLLLGWIISLILIFVINPQSFHWSMDFYMPVAMLASIAFTLVLAALLTAAWSARQAMTMDSVRAVRDE